MNESRQIGLLSRESRGLLVPKQEDKKCNDNRTENKSGSDGLLSSGRRPTLDSQ